MRMFNLTTYSFFMKFSTDWSASTIINAQDHSELFVCHTMPTF